MNNTKTTHKGRTPLDFIKALLVLIIPLALGWLVYQNAVGVDSAHPFRLGLDLAGGSQLTYEADTSGVPEKDVPELMNTLRSVIETRINVFGVSEPVVRVEQASFVASEGTYRLVVELPGITDVDEAVAEIGRTPLLEFKLVDPEAAAALQKIDTQAVTLNEDGQLDFSQLNLPNPYVDTGLTGRYLESAALEFTSSGQGMAGEPVVSIKFNKEGGDLFAEITRANIGRQLAIFLDGEVLSAPNINEAITGGTAMISGGFTPTEAKELAQSLNLGALPVPIDLVSTQTIGATLGTEILTKGMMAAMIGLAMVSLFMVFWYRLLGVLASLMLVVYAVITLALFQYIPVTITAAGLAGLILSLGMAVDANVLIFERFKEEFRAGKNSREAAREGFSRAWSAIRDGNLTSILTAIVLFWFGTAMVKGFALVFGLGVLVSMFTAITLTRTLMMTLPERKRADGGLLSWLLGAGITHK